MSQEYTLITMLALFLKCRDMDLKTKITSSSQWIKKKPLTESKIHSSQKS